MLATFATTTNLFVKNKERHLAFKEISHPWYFEEEFFKKNNATR
jgi:hypothetical protein